DDRRSPGLFGRAGELVPGVLLVGGDLRDAEREADAGPEYIAIRDDIREASDAVAHAAGQLEPRQDRPGSGVARPLPSLERGLVWVATRERERRQDPEPF